MNEPRETFVVDERTTAFYSALLMVLLLDLIMVFCMLDRSPRVVTHPMSRPTPSAHANDAGKPSPFTLTSSKIVVKKPIAPRAVLLETVDKKGAEWFTLRP